MYIQITSSLPRYIISHTHNVVRQVSQRRSPLLHRLLTNYKKEVPYCTNVTMTFHITIIHYKKKDVWQESMAGLQVWRKWQTQSQDLLTETPHNNHNEDCNGKCSIIRHYHHDTNSSKVPFFWAPLKINSPWTRMIKTKNEY